MYQYQKISSPEVLWKNSLSKNLKKVSGSLISCFGAYFRKWMILNLCRWVVTRILRYGMFLTCSFNRKITCSSIIKKMKCLKYLRKSMQSEHHYQRFRKHPELTPKVERLMNIKLILRNPALVKTSTTVQSTSLKRVIIGWSDLTSKLWELWAIILPSTTYSYLHLNSYQIFFLFRSYSSQLRRRRGMATFKT